jgi:hypothetical protein
VGANHKRAGGFRALFEGANRKLALSFTGFDPQGDI